MKQFQKYGVAAAVASIATGALATSVSKNEAGDLAIVPYYTVNDGKNTGIHIINTTPRTQVVKVRLRRGTDSKDALDFNLVMSPYDEWTANIGAGGPTGVQVTTNDTTCTVPEFPNGVAQMPATWAEGANEGYVEIVGMGQTDATPYTLATAGEPLAKRLTGDKAAEAQTLAVAAEHGEDGVPASCTIVREHFYRVAEADVLDEDVPGTHTSLLLSNGLCSATAVATTASACYVTGAVVGTNATALQGLINLTYMEDTQDDAFKVSWMVTDSAGGLEIGDNAVMVEEFASAPMMTNQQPLSFGLTGQLRYDPLNFELPNLAFGAWPSSNATRQAHLAVAGTPLTDGSMFDDLRGALNADYLINDWADIDADGSSVATDWVITLPGQYVMNNPICDFSGNYANATSTAMVCNSTAIKNEVMSRDELPLILANSAGYRLTLWDREEQNQAGETPTPEQDLGFSPSGEGDVPAGEALLLREVNVVSFGGGDVLGSSELQSEENGLRVVVDFQTADRGWGKMKIEPKPTTTGPDIWYPGATDDDDPILVRLGGSSTSATDIWGSWDDVADADATVAIGFAAWERSFADQAGNYGRAIEHTTIGSRS